jgi:hypothetical protein
MTGAALVAPLSDEPATDRATTGCRAPSPPHPRPGTRTDVIGAPSPRPAPTTAKENDDSH